MTDVANSVYVLLFSGDSDSALQAAAKLYPGRQSILLDHKRLREGGWKRQVREFRRLHGHALLFYFQSLADAYQERLLACTRLLHRCRETAFTDAAGEVRRYRTSDLLRLIPEVGISILADAIVLGASWIMLRILLFGAKPVAPRSISSDLTLDVAYLFPYPLNRYRIGGAMSHVRGVLNGLIECGARIRVFYAGLCPAEEIDREEVPNRRRLFLFWESLQLSFNLRFARDVRTRLRRENVGAFYQRHGRFLIAGALLSRWMGVPLILEYNGSEQWTSAHWDPSRFFGWLRLCERYMLRASTYMVVVSEPLKSELIEAGVPADRIVVNPNAVDPKQFHPGRGGDRIREQLGIEETDVVVAFLSTYSYFHGVKVLEQAIQRLSNDRDYNGPRLRFLLLGQGTLWQEMRDAIKDQVSAGIAVFTGAVPHEDVPAYLDAADILVSPHVPMPDGRPFFGSPTKLFEYMAMGKAIVASELDQIGQVLSHDQSAWLVEPGNVNDLASAIRMLAMSPERRARLGGGAREAALARHTWTLNARRLLEKTGLRCATRALSQIGNQVDAEHRNSR